MIICNIRTIYYFSICIGVVISYSFLRIHLNLNGKTKAVLRRKYSKGWAILNEAWRRTTRRRKSEGLVGQWLARRLTSAFGVGREVWSMAALGLEVVKLMAEHTTAWLNRKIGWLDSGTGKPQIRGCEAESILAPQPCLKCKGRQARVVNSVSLLLQYE